MGKEGGEVCSKNKHPLRHSQGALMSRTPFWKGITEHKAYHKACMKFIHDNEYIDY
jgi:hypothetical protein